MEQVIIGGYYDALNVATTEYNNICGGYTWHADEDDRAQAISTAGTIRNLRVELNDVPGTGTYTFTLRRAVGTGAWGDTTLTCTVAADGTVASDTEHDVTVAAGDVICLKCAPDSPDNARYVRWSVMFEGDTANESLLSSSNVFLKSATYYGVVQGNGGTTPEDRERLVCPTSGVIKDLYVQLEDDPGTAPSAFRFTLRINGANSDDGEGNPLQVTITADARTGNDTTHEITVSAGDRLTFCSEPLNSPAIDIFVAMGMTFVADTDGESLVMGAAYGPLDTAATEYTILTGHWNAPWTATEAQRYQLAQECTLKKLYMLLGTDPGGTDKYTFTVRLEGASPSSGLVVEIAGGSTTGNDTTNTISVSDGEVVNMMVVPTDTPAVGTAHWGLVCFTGVVLFEQSVGGGAITPTGALGAIKRFVQSVGSGEITPVGILGRLIKIGVGAGSITPTGALGLLIKIAVGAGSITPTGALSTIKKIFQTVGEGVITPIGTLNRLIKITVGQGAITPTGALAAIRIMVLALTVYLHSRSQEFALHTRSLTVKLHGRALTVALHARSETIKLWKRTLEFTTRSD